MSLGALVAFSKSTSDDFTNFHLADDFCEGEESVKTRKSIFTDTENVSRENKNKFFTLSSLRSNSVDREDLLI